jgi:2-isopropylmalate synthase
VNSQSGKGGVAYVLEADYGLRLPRAMQIEFSRAIQKLAEESGGEVASDAIWDAFRAEYLELLEPLEIIDYQSSRDHEGMDFDVRLRGVERRVHGHGAGPIETFVDALARDCGIEVRIVDYQEHALGEGSDAEAVSYVQVAAPDGARRFGAGRARDIVAASLAAIVSAVNGLSARGSLFG